MAGSQEELSAIAQTDDLHSAPLRDDSVTHGTPTWIWSVVVNGHLYARVYSGQSLRWYKAAMYQKAGRITAAGLTKDVNFKAVDGPINDRIDDAYCAKYNRSPYLKPMIGQRSRAATICLTPARAEIRS